MKATRVAWILLFITVLGTVAGLGCRRDGPPPGAPDRPPTTQVQHLRAFAKLFGYLRYFHPSDEASAVDWDRLAVLGAERVAGARDTAHLRQVLDELFTPVAPTLRLYPSNEPPPEIALPPATADTRPVAWQHVGFGQGSIRSAYRSARTNRRLEIAIFNHGFGTATARLPGQPHRGKNIRLSALVKVQGQDGGKGQLWMRVDRPNDVVGFFDNMDSRPITGTEWRRYQVQGKVDDDAQNISFGGFLTGAGKIWIDDFLVEVEGPPGRWTTVPVDNAGFEARPQPPDDAWPWITKSPGYSYTVVTDGVKQGKQALQIEQQREVIDKPLFAGGPELGELVTRSLGAGLSCRFPLVLPSSGPHTWGPAQRPLAPLLDALGGIDPQRLDAEEPRARVAGVIIAWNVFQHFYPYFDVVKVDWDAVLTRALHRALADRTRADFSRTLNWLVAQLQDGHGHVTDHALRGQGQIPCRLEWIEDQVVVTGAGPDSKLLPGDVVQTVGGRPAAELMREREEYLAGSPQWRRHRALEALTDGPEGSELALTLRHGTEVRTVQVPRLPYARQPDDQKPSMRQLEGGVWYVNLDQVTWQQIVPRLNEIAAAPGVVFDLRGYPKDNHNIIRYLLREDDQSKQWMQVAQIARPDQERLVGWEKHAWGLTRQAPHIKGRVAFITGPQAISYAESFMSFIEHYKLGEIVGEPTAGTNGNTQKFAVPAGFEIVFTGMKVLKHDGSQLFHVGIRPTIPVTRTLAGVRAGRDEAFEAALQVVRGKS